MVTGYCLDISNMLSASSETMKLDIRPMIFNEQE